MSTNEPLTLEQRIERIEEPVTKAKREAELRELQAAAEAAQRRIAELGAELNSIAEERRRLAPLIAGAEAALHTLKIQEANLDLAAMTAERSMGFAWQAIQRAEAAGRPAPPPAEPRKPLDLWDARERVWAWFKAWRNRPREWTPRIGPNQFLAAKVQITMPCVAGGAVRQRGETVIVPDAEVDTLFSNNRCEVIERKIVRDLPTDATVPVRALVGIRLGSGVLAAGETVLVDRATADAVRQGREPRLELIGPDADAARRVAELERKRAELEARFPGSRG